MKKLLVSLSLFLCLILQPTGYANSQVTYGITTKIDGSVWEKTPALYKAGFIAGFVEGVDIAILQIFSELLYGCTPEMFNLISLTMKQDGDMKKVLIAETVLSFDKELRFGFGTATYGQISDSIHKMYSDPRVKNWLIGNIMPLVKGRLQDGWTEKDVDEAIAFAIRVENMPSPLTRSDKDYLEKSEPKVYERARMRKKEALENLLFKLRQMATDNN